MEKKKINILYLIDTYINGGGTETHLADLVMNLDKDTFNPVICSFELEECPFVNKIRNSGIRIEYIPVRKIYSFEAFIQASKLMKFIKSNNTDIVQAFHFKSDTYGVLVSRLAGVKKIISSKRDLGDLKKKRQVLLNKLMNPYIDHFIVACNSVGEVVRKIEGVESKKMTTIYNGVNLRRFDLDRRSDVTSLKKELDIHDGTFVIGSIAYFRPEKAYHIFFEAIEKIKNSIENWAVLILGDGPLEEYFKSFCKERKLDRNVRFMGSVLDVPRYISLMDIICLVPNKNEGFSNAILEGMAMKKPIIATDVGGNAESVQDGETGFIIPSNDSEELSNAILKLFNDVNLRNRMGEKGRERIEKHFVLDGMIRKMEHLYLKLYQESNS